MFSTILSEGPRITLTSASGSTAVGRRSFLLNSRSCSNTSLLSGACTVRFNGNRPDTVARRLNHGAVTNQRIKVSLPGVIYQAGVTTKSFQKRLNVLGVSAEFLGDHL
jgi:hypothetical protein